MKIIDQEIPEVDRSKADSKMHEKSPENSRTKPRRKMVRASLVNLEKGVPFRWMKRESGNPGGRPQSAELSSAYRAILTEPCPLMPGLSYAEAIAVSLAVSAVRGNISAAAELCDRCEGRPIKPSNSLFGGLGF